MKGVLSGVKYGGWVGCVEGGSMSEFLEKACCWGILMDFSEAGE